MEKKRFPDMAEWWEVVAKKHIVWFGKKFPKIVNEEDYASMTFKQSWLRHVTG